MWNNVAEMRSNCLRSLKSVIYFMYNYTKRQYFVDVYILNIKKKTDHRVVLAKLLMYLDVYYHHTHCSQKIKNIYYKMFLKIIHRYIYFYMTYLLFDILIAIS